MAKAEGCGFRSRYHRRRPRLLGLGIGSSVVALAMTGLLLAVVPAPAVASSRHATIAKAVHEGVYYESTTPKKSASLDGASYLLVLSTPALPSGNYMATASAVDFTPEVLNTNGTAVATDFVDCYVAKLPNKTATFDGSRSVGYGGYSTMTVTDAFAKVSQGTKIGLYCYENEKTQGADIDWASLAVTPYATMYVKKGA